MDISESRTSRMGIMLVVMLGFFAFFIALAFVSPLAGYLAFGIVAFVFLIVIPIFIGPKMLEKYNGRNVEALKFRLMGKYYRQYYNWKTDNKSFIITLSVKANEARSDDDLKAFDPQLHGARNGIIDALETQAELDVIDSFIWQVGQYSWRGHPGAETPKDAKLFFLAGGDIGKIDIEQMGDDVERAAQNDERYKYRGVKIDGIGIDISFEQSVQVDEETVDVDNSLFIEESQQ